MEVIILLQGSFLWQSIDLFIQGGGIMGIYCRHCIAAFVAIHETDESGRIVLKYTYRMEGVVRNV